MVSATASEHLTRLTSKDEFLQFQWNSPAQLPQKAPLSVANSFLAV